MKVNDMNRGRAVWNSMAAVVLVAVAGLAGCGGGGSCPETPCDVGEVCRLGECVRPGQCPGGCNGNEVCRNGICVSGEGQCESAGDSCDVRSRPGDGFLCVPWDGDRSNAQCAEICSDDGTCSEGAACVLTQSLSDSACSSSSDCPDDKTCSEGRCRYAVCRPSECAGFLEGDEACQQKYGDDQERYPNGAKCYEVRNETNFCLPAGTRDRGEQCTGYREAVQQGTYTDTCARGLACESGTCVEACAGNDVCGEGEECVGIEGETVRPGVGQCASTCTPFAEGDDGCGEGEMCRPVDGDRGQCVSVGDKEAFASCQPGAGECREGLACIEHQEAQPRLGLAQVARCHPICNTSLGETDEEGELPDDAQERRDATCPQPETAEASYRVAHVAEGAGAVDVYGAGSDDSPIAAGLEAGTISTKDGGAYATVEVGQYDFSALPEGAPSTDLPLVEWTERLAAGQGRVFVLAAPGPDSDRDLRVVPLPAPESVEMSEGEVAVRVAHTMADRQAVDVVALPAGTTPGDGADEIVLADGLARDAATKPTSVASGSYDVHVYPEGTDRGGVEGMLSYEDVELSEFVTLHLRGTYRTDDAYPTHPITVLSSEPKPVTTPDKPPMTCVEPEDEAFGYCQQTCPAGPADYGTGICEGDSMGCKPTRNQNTLAWEHRCSPVGDREAGETCTPFAEVSECAEGNYCLEYGNTREGFRQGGDRGVCHSLCRTGDGEASGSGAELSCGSGESCKQLSYLSDFGVGQCGVACEPNDRFTDESCPDGLKSCKPVHSLQQDVEGDGNQPIVRREQSFCSASGNVEPGQTCRAQDCRPRGECMYRRSEQSNFINSLVSPYVGGSGGTPMCRLRCDPFDGDDSTATCGSDETCLFNYPWNAEVGHCAGLASNKAPGESCDNPGLACGEDSICVQQEGQSTCVRFCDYEGPDVQGEPQQSTCPEGYLCQPFARDIGRCERE